MQKILLVDDDENILSGYRRNLRPYFQLYTANGPGAALLILKDNKDISVVISDFRMPEMNGIEFLSKVKEQLPNAVRILLTGNAELNMAIDAVNEGSIFRFLTKPCGHELLKASILQGIEQYKLIVAEKELLENTLKGSLKILIDILAIVNSSIFNRSILIRNKARKLLTRLNIPDNWEIDIACLLSRIGSVGIPNDILEKHSKGISLDKTEMDLFNSQAQIGKELLKNIPRLENVAEAISLQYKPINEVNLLRNFTGDASANERIVFISGLLKLLNDFFYYLEKEDNEKKALRKLWENKGDYNLTLLGALEAEELGTEEGYIAEYCSIEELKKGMTLGDDLFDRKNTLLLPKGTVLSEINIIKIKNYTKIGGIQEKILIQKRLNEPAVKIS